MNDAPPPDRGVHLRIRRLVIDPGVPAGDAMVQSLARQVREQLLPHLAQAEPGRTQAIGIDAIAHAAAERIRDAMSRGAR